MKPMIVNVIISEAAAVQLETLASQAVNTTGFGDPSDYEQDLVAGFLAVLQSDNPAAQLDALTAGDRGPASILAALASHGQLLSLQSEEAARRLADADAQQAVSEQQDRDDNIGVALDLIWEAEDPRLVWDQVMDARGAGVTHTSVLDALARFGAATDPATRARLTGQLPTEETDTSTE